MHKLFSRTFAALALSLLATIGQTGAAKAPSAPITFSQTRVVFNEGAKSASIDVTNKSETPYMLATSVRLVSVDRQTTRNDRAFFRRAARAAPDAGRNAHRTNRQDGSCVSRRRGRRRVARRGRERSCGIRTSYSLQDGARTGKERTSKTRCSRRHHNRRSSYFYRPTMLVNDTACAKRQRRSTPTAS